MGRVHVAARGRLDGEFTRRLKAKPYLSAYRYSCLILTVASLFSYCERITVATTRQAVRLLRSTLHSLKCYPDEIQAAP
jgi:hypothetical protein